MGWKKSSQQKQTTQGYFTLAVKLDSVLICICVCDKNRGRLDRFLQIQSHIPICIKLNVTAPHTDMIFTTYAGADSSKDLAAQAFNTVVNSECAVARRSVNNITLVLIYKHEEPFTDHQHASTYVIPYQYVLLNVLSTISMCHQ